MHRGAVERPRAPAQRFRIVSSELRRKADRREVIAHLVVDRDQPSREIVIERGGGADAPMVTEGRDNRPL